MRRTKSLKITRFLDSAEKIILLAKDKGLGEELGRNARGIVMKEHTWEKRGKEIINIYNTIIRGD